MASYPSTAENRTIQKEYARLQRTLRGYVDEGLYLDVEHFFNSSMSLERRPEVHRLNEELMDCHRLSLTSDPHDPRVIFLDFHHMKKTIESSGITKVRAKPLLKSLERFHRLSNDVEKWELLRQFYSAGVPLHSVIGLSHKNRDNVRAAYSIDWERFRHCLGLSIAIHVAMYSLGVRVSMPERYVTHTRVLPIVRSQKRSTMSFLRNLRENNWQGIVRCRRVASEEARPWYLLCHYLRVFPANQAEKVYVKIVKDSLVTAFGNAAQSHLPEERRELPTAKYGVFPLFPLMTQRILDRIFSSSSPGVRARKLQFYFSLLQSKGLCAPIGTSFIEEALENHKNSLCRPMEDVIDVPQEYLRKLRKKGAEIGRRVNELLEPNVTSLPNTRACLERSSGKGGSRAALRDRITIERGPIYAHPLVGHRIEPTVIGLFGPPGAGKSTLISSLGAYLHKALFREVPLEKLTYSRSCATTHWDGYTGQPIVILDDLGQNILDRSDLVEFEQLISTNEYHVPMADLSSKGMLMTSKIIIVTSNLQYNSCLKDSCGHFVLEDDMSFWRRFSLPLHVTRVDGRVKYDRIQGISLPRKPMSQHAPSYFRNNSRLPMDASAPYSTIATYYEKTELFSKIKNLFLERVDFHHSSLSGYWKQDIFKGRVGISGSNSIFKNVEVEPKKYTCHPNDISISIKFPRIPPFHAPEVKAIPLSEPLKCRIITKAESDVKALQPLQRALFDYMSEQPQFCLTHGVTRGEDDILQKVEWIHRIEKKIQCLNKTEEGFYLSGDYDAATDNFPMSVTQALVEGLCSEIDHEPTRDWLQYEVRPHRIVYPNGPPGGFTQTSGQLMGSLVSFPLLCFLNDFTMEESGFAEGSYLINGDDVVGHGSMESIETWRSLAPKVGLSLSKGKNFIDKNFVL